MSFVILAVFLSLVPADVSTFTLESPAAGEQKLKLTKDDEGWWKIIEPAEAGGAGVFRVKDGAFVVQTGDQLQSLNLDVLGIAADVDWSKLEELDLSNGLQLQIDRVENGLDLRMSKDGELAAETMKLRWEAEE